MGGALRTGFGPHRFVPSASTLSILGLSWSDSNFSVHDADAACVFRVKLLPLYVAESSCICLFSRLCPFYSPACFALSSRCSYANYARLVMFSFGFQKAFQRGFEPDDEVFFIRVIILPSHTVSAEINANRRFHRAWKAPRPSSRYLSILWFRRVTYVTRQTVCKPHATLFLISTPHTYTGYFVFAAFASAFMLKVRDCSFCRRVE